MGSRDLLIVGQTTRAFCVPPDQQLVVDQDRHPDRSTGDHLEAGHG
jgi:hypothetical protein